MTEYEIKRLEDRIRELWKEKEGLLKENAELEQENKEAKGLLNEMRIALRQTKDGAKYNVSLLEDVDKLLEEKQNG